MGDLLGKYRSLQVYMDACVHCGACSDKCHYFLGTGDPKNMPVARQDLMRKVYRRHFTFAGKHFPKLVGAEALVAMNHLKAGDADEALGTAPCDVCGASIIAELEEAILDIDARSARVATITP